MIMHVLIVCTGNLCRSPMAAGLLSSLLPRISVASAGISADPGQPADAFAVDALRQFSGIDIATHRTRRLNERMCDMAELILVMERQQQRVVERAFGGLRGKVYCFDPDEDIVDPYRRSQASFETCLAHIAADAPRWVRRLGSI